MKTLDLIISGLAAARLTQLVVDDEITQPVRDVIRRSASDDVFWDQVDTAVNCHACSSIWAGAGVLIAGKGGPVGRFLVTTLALSQAALATKALIDRIDR